MNNKFCPKCYQYMLQHNLISPIIPLDNIVFRCSVPIYTSDGCGVPTVLVWNCDLQKYEEMTQKEYESKYGL